MATQLKFQRGGLQATDPHTHPITIVGQLEHLKTLGYDKVKVKFGDRVSEEVRFYSYSNNSSIV